MEVVRIRGTNIGLFEANTGKILFDPSRRSDVVISICSRKPIELPENIDVIDRCIVTEDSEEMNED